MSETHTTPAPITAPAIAEPATPAPITAPSTVELPAASTPVDAPAPAPVEAPAAPAEAPKTEPTPAPVEDKPAPVDHKAGDVVRFFVENPYAETGPAVEDHAGLVVAAADGRLRVFGLGSIDKLADFPADAVTAV